jgi:hypothetical protein
MNVRNHVTYDKNNALTIIVTMSTPRRFVVQNTSTVCESQTDFGKKGFNWQIRSPDHPQPVTHLIVPLAEAGWLA